MTEDKNNQQTTYIHIYTNMSDEDEGVEMSSREMRRKKRERKRRRRKKKGDEEDNEDEEEKEEVTSELTETEEADINKILQLELCDRDEAIKLYNDNSKDVDETIKALKGGKNVRKRRDRKKREKAAAQEKDAPAGNFKSRRAKLREAKNDSTYLVWKTGSSVFALLIFIGCFTGYYHLCMVYRICMNNVDPAVPQIHTDRFIPFMIFGILFSFWAYGAAMSESYKNLFVYALLAFTYSIVMLVYGVELGDLGDKASGKSKDYATTAFNTFTSIEQKYYPNATYLQSQYERNTGTMGTYQIIISIVGIFSSILSGVYGAQAFQGRND